MKVITMTNKKLFSIEFNFHCSPQLLFQYLSTPSGLSEWFADDVNSRGEDFTFIWEDSEEYAKLLTKKNNELKHLIYFSKTTILDEQTTANILSTSRNNNDQSEVTGALICRSDLYFQFLEGPKDSVEATFQKIKLDTRHSEIYKIKDDLTNRRLFASWAMRDDPVHTWMWTREEVKNGILTRIAPNEAFATFERLSREVDQFTP